MLPNGNDSLTSWTGLIMTIVLWVILLAYASLEFLNLQNNDGTHLAEYTRLNQFDHTYEFKMDKNNRGLEIAFGFTPYDDNEEPIYEPDYGELKAFTKSWNKTYGIEFHELRFR